MKFSWAWILTITFTIHETVNITRIRFGVKVGKLFLPPRQMQILKQE